MQKDMGKMSCPLGTPRERGGRDGACVASVAHGGRTGRFLGPGAAGRRARLRLLRARVIEALPGTLLPLASMRCLGGVEAKFWRPRSPRPSRAEARR